MKAKFTKTTLETILSNPFYCLEQIDTIFTIRHKPLIDRKKWIKANIYLIKELGTEKWLTRLLENLEGKYIT